MGEWIDFTDLKAKVSLEDVIVRYYGLETLARKGSKLIGPCPVHGGDSPRAFNADLEKGVWFCYTKCRGGGNQLDLVARKEGVSIREAALRLKAHFLGEGNGAAPRPASRPPNGSPSERGGGASRAPRRDASDDAGNPPLDVRLQLDGTHPHLVRERELRPETVAHFGVGYCARGILRGMIAVPIHDEEGALVAYAGRRLQAQAIREEGKYKLPKNFKKQLVLYNFHRAVPFAAEHGLILVEGFFSVMKLYEAGLQNVVASMGTDLSEAQAELLGQAREVVLLFDGDEAGRAGALAARTLLEGRVPTRLVTLPENLEPEGLSAHELRWLLEGLDRLGLSEIAFSRKVHQDAAEEEARRTAPARGVRELGPPAGSARCAHD